MQSKPNFIFYLEYWEQLKLLDDKQKGHLLSALFAFQLGEKIPDLDPMTNMAFSFISADVRRNNEKYAEISEKRREAGRTGGRQKAKKQTEAKKAFAYNSDSDSDSDSDSECVSVSDSNALREPDTQHDTHTTHDTHTRPTFEEVIAEIYLQRYGIDDPSAEEFMKYNDRLGWRMDWREALAKWNEQEARRKSAAKPATPPAQKRQTHGPMIEHGENLDAIQSELAKKARQKVGSGDG